MSTVANPVSATTSIKLSPIERQALSDLLAAATALQAISGEEARLCCRKCWQALAGLGTGDHSVLWERALADARALLNGDQS